jgi:predicted transcriptional regulator
VISLATIISIDEIKRLRRSAGLTQKETAEKAGVSQSLIARIERGTVDPRLSTIRKIVAALTPAKNARSARDLMSSPVVSIDAHQSIRSAVDKMKKTGFSQLPVLMEGRIIGNVHESTILEKIARSSSPEQIMSSPVYNIMEKSFRTVDPEDSVADVVKLLVSGEPALLVVGRGKLLGIITKIDVLSGEWA